MGGEVAFLGWMGPCFEELFDSRVVPHWLRPIKMVNKPFTLTLTEKFLHKVDPSEGLLKLISF